MQAVTQQDPPEALGPGTAHPDGLVTYGQPAAPAPAAPTRPRPDPPEALGPATEYGNGSYSYGQPGFRPGPMPLPTPEERTRERAITADLIASCDCATIPGGVLTQLAQLARRAAVPPAEGIGCPRCRAVPPGLVQDLADALEA
jgi:hypothetical protein